MCLDENHIWTEMRKTAKDIMARKKGKTFVGWRVYETTWNHGVFQFSSLAKPMSQGGRFTVPGWKVSDYDPERPCKHKGFYVFLTKRAADTFRIAAREVVVRVMMRRDDVIEVGTTGGRPTVRVRNLHVSNSQMVKIRTESLNRYGDVTIR